MDIQAEKLNLIKWMVDVNDPLIIERLIALKNDYRELVEEGDLLSEYQKQQILKGLEEADTGLGIPANDVIQQARKKYGSNR